MKLRWKRILIPNPVFLSFSIFLRWFPYLFREWETETASPWWSWCHSPRVTSATLNDGYMRAQCIQRGLKVQTQNLPTWVSFAVSRFPALPLLLSSGDIVVLHRKYVSVNEMKGTGHHHKAVLHHKVARWGCFPLATSSADTDPDELGK